ncbi:MAG: hypothetical protein HRU15_08825, partial [Planctomycetes bacterium]|nr:hypothetical protein [Planctomycetota bacterium]
ETPHLFPFMQGQSVEQKHFRLAHLLNKIVQISELYQRIESVIDDPVIGEKLQACEKSRERFMVLAEHRVAPLKVDRAFIGSTLLCPFPSFATWVQDRLRADDFTLPPESKSRK